MGELRAGEVTLLFTDIEGSTRLWEAEPAAMAAALAMHDRIISSIVHEAGGRTFNTVGDAFCVAFDDVDSAAAAALGIQGTLSNADWPTSRPLRVRIGVHSGDCRLRDDGQYFGASVSRVARLHAIGHGGQVLLSGRAAAALTAHEEITSSRWVMSDLGEHRLKDLTDPERVWQLSAAGSEETFPPLRSLDNPQLRHNLPSRTTGLVGREHDLQRVLKLIHQDRVVTLAGAGGVGKTRLALQVAAESVEEFTDGVWFVDLSSIADPGLIASTICDAMRERISGKGSEIEELAELLSDRQALIVLDNCEHLAQASADVVATLTARCAQLQLLATSRQSLGVDGEQVFRVPSLSLPAATDVEVDDIASAGAVRLFVERAARAGHEITLDSGNAPIAATICRRLDGIPLALELAATKLRSMSLSDLESRLDRMFGSSGERDPDPRSRHRTLGTLIDWSYGLLDAVEQRTLDRFSVFAGGFSLDAAEAVATTADLAAADVIDVVDALVDKSLLQVDKDESGAVSYRLLDTIHVYVGHRLAERPADEGRDARVAHRDFYLSLAEATAELPTGMPSPKSIQVLQPAKDNLRLAVAFCLDDPDPSYGLRLLTALGDYWLRNGHGPEGRRYVDAQLQRAEEAPAELVCKLSAMASVIWVNCGGSLTRALEMGQRAVEIAETLDDDMTMLAALNGLMIAECLLGQYEQSISTCERALAISESPAHVQDGRYWTAKVLTCKGACIEGLGGDSRELHLRSAEIYEELGLPKAGPSLNNLGCAEVALGNYDAAIEYLQRARTIFHEAGSLVGEANTVINLANTLHLQGDPGAEDLLREAVSWAKKLCDEQAYLVTFAPLALELSRSHRPREAAFLHGSVDRILSSLGPSMHDIDMERRDADLAGLADLLDDELPTLRRRGQHTDLEVVAERLINRQSVLS